MFFEIDPLIDGTDDGDLAKMRRSREQINGGPVPSFLEFKHFKTFFSLSRDVCTGTCMSPLAAVLTNGVHLGEEIVRTVLGQTANTLMYEYVA